MPFCAVSASAFALAILSSVLFWKLFNGGNNNNVEDVTTNLSSNIVSQTIGTNLSLPGNPEGDSKPSDMSFRVNQVEVDGHVEYEMSLSFKNFDQYMYGGYRCTIKYLEDETWSRDIYLESVLDECVTIKTYLADYARSGTYYIEYFVVILMDAAKNIATISLPAENVLTY